MLAPAQMLASDVHSLLRAPPALGADAAIRKAWLSTQARPCKDVVALGMPLRRVPTTLDGFRQTLGDNGKGNDWVISSWYVVYVGVADGREWGWSNAPYDTKKRVADTKPLYSTDADGPTKGQTRFWSFKKVSNNMNKGPRMDAQDGEDLSFVLPAGTTFSHFLREDSYGDKPIFNAVDEQPFLEAYAPVLLQLSSTNNEQAAKGNGLKLRRVIPLPASITSTFSDKFYTRKSDLEEAQQRACSTTALAAMSKPVAGSPLAVKVDRSAFWFYDEPAHVVEILDSGVDPEMGNKVVVAEEVLLKSLHSVDIKRALRMLTVALGHGAVTCVVAVDKNDPPGVCRVVHLHVDTAETMWLTTLQRLRLLEGSDLPKTSQLTMCFGSPISSGMRSDILSHLQWYAPGCRVPMATEDGREVSRHIVFELVLEPKNDTALRDVAHKALLMDEVAGPHYALKIYQANSVIYDPACGLLCEDPELLLCWQLRPGMGMETGGASASSARKRQFVTADERDHGEQDSLPDSRRAKRQEHEATPELA